MRDRVVEFLPLLLVALVLGGYELLHQGVPPSLALLPVVPTAIPSPAAGVPPRPALPVPTSAPSSTCQPRFVGGLAQLRAAVGPIMGDPLECEHSVNAQGDTQQKTTTGLAYYLHSLNAACFTTGYDHWSLAADGSLIRWTGDSIDPPLE